MIQSQMICPACASAQVKSVLTIADHEYAVMFQARYAQCASCLTIFQTPMPDLAQLAEFYPAQYHSFDSRNPLMRFRNQMRLKRLQNLVPAEDITILDYGCGHGGFLEQASLDMPRARCFGYEIGRTKEIVKCGRDNVTIIKGSLKDLLDELPPCDLITMNHVIEHLPDPLEVLRILHGSLKKQGVIEGQTPAADSLEHDIFGPLWAGYHAPRHTVVFSRKGLTLALNASGFQQAKVTGAFNPAGIAVSLASLARGNVPSSIPRKGLGWMIYLAAAVAVSPIDLLSSRPGVMDFVARKVE